MKVLSRRKGAEYLTPGDPSRVACVDAGSKAGFGRTGGDGGIETVSFAAEQSAAMLKAGISDLICIVCVCICADRLSCDSRKSVHQGRYQRSF
jgi:hypothetical protein